MLLIDVIIVFLKYISNLVLKFYLEGLFLVFKFMLVRVLERNRGYKFEWFEESLIKIFIKIFIIFIKMWVGCGEIIGLF